MTRGATEADAYLMSLPDLDMPDEEPQEVATTSAETSSPGTGEEPHDAVWETEAQQEEAWVDEADAAFYRERKRQEARSSLPPAGRARAGGRQDRSPLKVAQAASVFAKVPGVSRLLAGVPGGRRAAAGVLLVPVLGAVALVVGLLVSRPAGTVEVTLPDDGTASVGDVTLEGSAVTGVVSNTGTVAVEVAPSFTVYTWDPGLNPVTWFTYRQAAACEAEPVALDPGEQVTVQSDCGAFGGWSVKAEGALE